MKVLPGNVFFQLKKRLQIDEKYFNDYKNFIDDIIQHGEAEEVAASQVNTAYSWYIPHHGVYHPKKPGKIRVVFDCSARYNGVSLNDYLLSGPDLNNSLIGVLCRFRQENVAFMGDIERMFHQFKVNIEHRDYLRFLWWKDGDLKSEPTVYRMKVHLFGASSSPGCANYGMKKIAVDNQKDFGIEVSNFIIKDFYVDDGLKSAKTTPDAIQLIHDARQMLARGNLRLHKFISNSREVIESIPNSERAKGITSLNLSFEDLPIERALGIEWCMESDHFQFRFNLKSKSATRRGILSTVASVYDPLGLLSPYTLKGKQILQQMCKENCGWDEPLSEELRPKWEQWIQELPLLSDIHIDRCVKPAGFGNISVAELHHFSDASFCGYGQCSYLRIINEDGQVHCSLLMGKARVAPLKVVTIPRLELTAALVSVKISQLLRYELDIVAVEYFWTDSMVTLGYIQNDARRFHVFVANRVQQIKEATKVEQWHYVETKENPADLASRGANAKELLTSTWFSGPKFLWEKELSLGRKICSELKENDPEIRKALIYAVSSTTPVLLERIEKFSSWFDAVTALAVLKKYLRHLQLKVQVTPITESDRLDAETTYIRLQQQYSFAKELGNLSQKKAVSQDSTLSKLDPFVDKDGMLRVGGRLTHSSQHFKIIHPLILPKSSHVTHLIVKHFHEVMKHQGRGITVNALRQNGFWIIGCSRVVSSLIFKCVTCRKLRGQLQSQKMSNLPSDRLAVSPPFTYCGMDCFGPFLIQEGRKQMKKYGLLITCMASRAIHIEMLDDMTADACINGLRCFIALRGPVQQIRCDQGSNFVGTRNIFKDALVEMEPELRNFLLKNKCDFLMNVPSASHMGGVWERQIRTIRSVLSAILVQHKARLDSSSLRTFFYEAMSIVNGRPLSVDHIHDPTGPVPLTPNLLLTMKSSVVLPPPGKFVEEDVYARKRWRRVQYLANEFWNKWKKEYVHMLQERQKWKKPQRNMEIGDIVILKDEDIPRGYWKLARVTEVTKDSDDLVRKVKVLIGDATLSKHGKRLRKPVVLERPIHKLVLLLEAQ